jgi:hypothetical protein
MRRTTTDGTIIQSTGRWIAIRSAYVTERHMLHDYADEDGALLYFSHYGRRFALGQFLRFGSPWGSPGVPMWEDADGLHHMAGYQDDCWHDPLMIEISEYGDAVRVWQEVST